MNITANEFQKENLKILLDEFFGENAYRCLFNVNHGNHSDHQEILNRRRLLEEFLNNV